MTNSILKTLVRNYAVYRLPLSNLTVNNPRKYITSDFQYTCIISSPEPKAHWWAYRIGRTPSSAVCHPHSLNIFFSETTGPTEAKFHMESSQNGERKFVQMVLVTWPRLPPCPYMVKTLKNLLLRNQNVDDLETWYAASSTRVLPSLFKWWPWVDPDLF